MLNKKQKIAVIIGVFLLAVLMNIIGIFLKNENILFVFRPLILGSLMLLYYNSVKKVNVLFLSCQFAGLIGDFLMLFKQDFFTYAVLCYIISQTLLILIILRFKHVKLTTTVIYFAFSFFCFIIIYLFVLEYLKGYVILVMAFGISISVLTALSIVNYLNKMYMANYLLFLGLAFGVLSTVLMSLDIFNSSNFYTNIFIFTLNVIMHYLVCRSFITREDKTPNKKVFESIVGSKMLIE